MISDHREEYKKIAAKLRFARRSLGLNQGRLSAAIDKSQSYISKVEAGKINIGAVELHMLAQIYKKPIDYFLS